MVCMLLTPYTIKQTTFKNRVVMPPMCMYSVFKKDGHLTDFHDTHYTARALGGVGYIIIESTGVTPEGRITDQDLGIWDDTFIPGFKKLVDRIHAFDARVGLQINHAGRKSQITPTVSASNIPFSNYDAPRALSLEEINEVIHAFGQAARRAHEAGFDALEIHAAHGYLINQFISPLSNKRDDIYQDGTKLLKEIIGEIKKYWPKEKILQIRISAYEYSDQGLTPYDWTAIINTLKADLDIIHVSSGGNISVKVDEYEGYQLSYARIIRDETNLPVIAGGLIDDIVVANKTLNADEADFIYYGRKLLREPFFLLTETDISWPEQYIRAKNK